MKKTKEDFLDELLANPVYSPESSLVKNLRRALGYLSKWQLDNLNILVGLKMDAAAEDEEEVLPEKQPRKVKRYEVKYPVSVDLALVKDSGTGYVLTMTGIESTDSEENALLGEDGEFSCWDSGAEMENGVLTIDGNDGPGGGAKIRIVLTVPMQLIRSVNWSVID